MRNVLAVLAIGSLFTLATGWYRDWYKVERGASGPGSSHFHVTVHSAQAQADLTAAWQKARAGGEWVYARCQELGTKPESKTAGQPVEVPESAEESSSAPLLKPVPEKWR